ncbi:MAG TPA: hypothetical protein VMI10_09820 [Terriglobales bacterium]|nr:hypothetical protein [Terriglobales bacterium]
MNAEAATWLVADEELQRLHATLRQLEHALSREGAELSCAAYQELQARISQQKQRLELATAKEKSARAALDIARSREAEREAEETRQRRYDVKQAEFHQAESALAEAREKITQLNQALPALEQKFNIALRELAEAKGAL